MFGKLRHMLGVSDEERKAQIGFLTAAISDTQGIIKVIDTKVTALFFGLAIPLTKLRAIWGICRTFLGPPPVPNGLCEVVVLVFAFSWVVSVWASLRTLWRMQNPSEFVSGATPAGTFFAGGLFKPRTLEALLGGDVANKADFNRYYESVPGTLEAISRELAYEHMKVVFIRTVKMERSNVAYAGFAVWLACGGLIWLDYLRMK